VLDAVFSSIALIPGLGFAIAAPLKAIFHAVGNATELTKAISSLGILFGGTKEIIPHLDEIYADVKAFAKKIPDSITSLKNNFVGVLKHKATSGVKLFATHGKTTTILGRYSTDTKAIIKELGLPKSTDFNGNLSNLLNTPDDLYKSADQFWNEYNKPFLDAAISRGDKILMATPVTKKYLNEPGTTKLTGYGREYYYSLNKGYKYVNGNNKQGGKMIPESELNIIKDNAKFLLTKGFNLVVDECEVIYNSVNWDIIITYEPYSDVSTMSIKFNKINEFFDIGWIAFVRHDLQVNSHERLSNILKLLIYLSDNFYDLTNYQFCKNSDLLIDKYIDENKGH